MARTPVIASKKVNIKTFDYAAGLGDRFHITPKKYSNNVPNTVKAGSRSIKVM